MEPSTHSFIISSSSESNTRKLLGLQEIQARFEQHTQSCNSVEGTCERGDSYVGKALGGGSRGTKT